MLAKVSALFLLTVAAVAGQRPFFAGLRPIGYPDTPNRTTTVDPLGNRFGEGNVLPVEANGDRDLVDRLSKLPLDQQPFWLLNWQALEENRKHPQTYPQKPNVFAEPPILRPDSIALTYPPNQNQNGGLSNSGNQINNNVIPNTSSSFRPGSLDWNFVNNSGNQLSNFNKVTTDSGLGNRFGEVSTPASTKTPDNSPDPFGNYPVSFTFTSNNTQQKKKQ